MQADLVLPKKNRYCVVCRRRRRCGGRGRCCCCLLLHHARIVAGISEFSSDSCMIFINYLQLTMSNHSICGGTNNRNIFEGMHK